MARRLITAILVLFAALWAQTVCAQIGLHYVAFNSNTFNYVAPTLNSSGQRINVPNSTSGVNWTVETVNGVNYNQISAGQLWAPYALKVGTGVYDTQRFETHFGDCSWVDGSAPCTGNPKVRSEFDGSGSTNTSNGTDWWISDSFYWEGGNPIANNGNQWFIAGQAHHQVCASGEGTESPPFAFNITPGGTLQAVYAYNTTPCNPTSFSATSITSNLVTGITRNVWHSRVVEMICNPTGTGTLNVWIDGVQRLAYSGHLCYAGEPQGPYWKYGIYSGDYTSLATWPQNEAVRYANVEVGCTTKYACGTSLAARILHPLPTPPDLSLSFALKWPMPPLYNPVTLTIPTSGDYNSPTEATTQDCLLQWPASLKNGHVYINGCHNIESQGGLSNITPQGSDLTNSAQSRGIYINGASGIVDVQGLDVENGGPSSPNSMMDGIVINAPSATVQLQNDRIFGVFGYNDQFHADCVQPYGGVRALLENNITCYSAYQGNTIDQDVGPIGSAVLDNVNEVIFGPTITGTHNSGGYLLDVFRAVDCSDNYPTSFLNVYLGSQRPVRTDLSYLVLTSGNGGGGSCNTLAGSLTGNATITGGQFSGHLTWGAAPFGDYAPASKVGLFYAAPALPAAPTLPTTGQTFDQARVSMGLNSTSQDFLFGSSVSPGAGQTAITNLTDLATYFTPQQQAAGLYTINSEFQRYPAFNTTNHAFASSSLNLTALIDTSGGYGGAYATVVTQATGAGINLDGTSTPIARFGLANTTGISLGQIVGLQSVQGVYYVSALVANTSISLSALDTASPTTQSVITQLVTFYPYYAAQSSGTVSAGATTLNFGSLPAGVVNHFAVGVVSNANAQDIQRAADYRVTGIAGGAVTISPSAGSEMASPSGAFYVFGPPITSGQFWSKNYFTYTDNSYKAVAFDSYVTMPTDSSSGYNTRGVNTAAAFASVPSNYPWGSWPAVWTYSAVNDCPACATDGSEMDFMEMYRSTTEGPFQWSGSDHIANGSVNYSAFTYQKTNAGWSNAPGFGVLTAPSAQVGAHRYSFIQAPWIGTYRYVDNVLVQIDTYNWTSGHQGQWGIDLAIGGLNHGNIANMLGPFNTTGFANTILGISEVKIYQQ